MTINRNCPLHTLFLVRVVFFVVTFLSLGYQLFAQASVPEERERLVRYGWAVDADSYFYNAEFDHPLKPGYTLPGFSLSPRISLNLAQRLYLEAGAYLGYMHGKKALQVLRPVFSVRAELLPDFWCTIGTLASPTEFPEFLYTRQYSWLHGPEGGAAFRYANAYLVARTWIDWDRFIWKDDNDEERFLYGFTLTSPTPTYKPGWYYNAFLLARHHGGQIDTSALPVVTSTNMGARLGYAMSFIDSAKYAVGLLLTAVASHDGHKQTPLTARNGYALHSELWLRTFRVLTLAAGYFYGRNFISLRGEELYRSYSLWSRGRCAERRSIVTGTLSLQQPITRYAYFQAGASGFYDLAFRRIDYDFYIRLVVNFVADFE